MAASFAGPKTAHSSKQDRPDVAAKQRAWLNARPDLDSERLVFLDGTGAPTRIARLRGLSPARAALPRPCPARPLEDDDLHRHPAIVQHGRADSCRRTHEPGRFPRLHQPGVDAHAPARRHHRYGQPTRPQGAEHPDYHRGRRREPALSPTLFPGLLASVLIGQHSAILTLNEYQGETACNELTSQQPREQNREPLVARPLFRDPANACLPST